MDVTLSDPKARKIASTDLSSIKRKFVIPAKALGLIVLSFDAEAGLNDVCHDEIARAFQKNRLATLTCGTLVDLKARNGEAALAAGRQLVSEITEATTHEHACNLPISIFGTYAGATAALLAAGELGHRIHSVVACGGQMDLGRIDLNKIKSPTLLIVGGRDIPLVEANRRAASLLRCETSVAVIPRASHFFEEPGARSAVTRAALEWILKSFHGNRILIPQIQ